VGRVDLAVAIAVAALVPAAAAGGGTAAGAAGAMATGARAAGARAGGATALEDSAGGKVVGLASDGLGFCALLASGSVRCWGTNQYGALGVGPATSTSDVPVTVKGLSQAASVVGSRGGVYGYCATLAGGKVSCWGLAGSASTDGAVAVPGLSGATSLASDGVGFCAVVSGGKVGCWGSGSSGALGNGSFTTNTNTPVTVTGLTGATLVASDRDGSFCALVAAGRVACWGNGAGGALGDGSSNEIGSATPKRVQGLSGATGLASDYTGYCARLRSGTARCWGNDSEGGLGNGATAPRIEDAPVAVKGLTGAERLLGDGYAGNGYCALLASGGVSCWGSNAAGALGNGGSEALSDVPVGVHGVSGASLLAESPGDFCAGGRSGAECWGTNDYGQLGTGSSASGSGSAVPVEGLRDVTSLVGGGQAFCAVVSGGVWCWGDDVYGQLGGGAAHKAFASDVPVQVSGLAS